MALPISTMFWGVFSAFLIFATLLFASSVNAQDRKPLSDFLIAQYGTPPAIPTGPLSTELQDAIQIAFVDSVVESTWGDEQHAALAKVVASADPRIVWIVSDLMRFAGGFELRNALAEVASELLGKDLQSRNSWGDVTDHLIAWDIPAPPNYLDTKRALFVAVVPAWDKIFVEGDIDWRLVSWAGVLIDDRAYDTTDEECSCIPAADNPEVIPASEATWLQDGDIVFGI